jgi:hypothetical protein
MEAAEPGTNIFFLFYLGNERSCGLELQLNSLAAGLYSKGCAPRAMHVLESGEAEQMHRALLGQDGGEAGWQGIDVSCLDR